MTSSGTPKPCGRIRRRKVARAARAFMRPFELAANRGRARAHPGGNGRRSKCVTCWMKI